MHKKAYGFTIVELLVVIVIVAILVVISIASYVNFNNKAHDTIVQGDLRNFTNKIEAYRAEYGAYPSNNTQLTAAMTGFSVTQSSYDTSYYNFTYRVAIDRDVYAVAARSKSRTIWFRSSTDSGVFSQNTTYGGVVNQLIGIMTDPSAEPSFGTYGYRLATDDWADWAK